MSISSVGWLVGSFWIVSRIICAITGKAYGESFQYTAPEASIRRLMGSGGLTGGGGGLFVGCGRLMSIGYDRTGAVTMKMMSRTSITSTSGVTLMSAIAWPPELDANAISVSGLSVL